MRNTLLYSTPYERDTPNMSRAKCLKRGESAVSALLNQVPVRLLVEITYA